MEGWLLRLGASHLCQALEASQSPPPDRAAGDDCRPPHHRFTERMLVWGSRRSMNHWKPLEASHVAALCSASASPRRWQKPALEFDLASSGTSCSPPQSKSPLLCPKPPLHLSLVSSLAQQSALVSPLVPSTPSRDTSRVQHSGPPGPRLQRSSLPIPPVLAASPVCPAVSAYGSLVLSALILSIESASPTLVLIQLAGKSIRH